MLDSKTQREKDWHNKRFADGLDARKETNVGYAYQAVKFAEKRFKNLQKKSNIEVLDIGCGRGIDRALNFANKNCIYTGVDISEECIKANNKDIKNITDKANFFVDDANVLSKLKNKTFNLVILTGTLHHLDIDSALKSISLITNPIDGEVLMWEPLGTNPLINFFRFITPNLRTPDEKPLDFKDLSKIKSIFPNSKFEFHALTSLFAIPLTLFKNKLFKNYISKFIYFLGRLDLFLGKIPFIRRFCWIVIIKAKL